jgi:hypothetical protein
MRSFFAGTLHRLSPDRSPSGRQTIDQAISAVWRAYSEGRIDEHEAHRLDAELRRRRARIVTPFARPSAFALFRSG